MAYVVDLKKYQYTGPLDMLLDMIHAAKIDIKDIFISEITAQYLASMENIGDLDMDSASEFLQMAATLLEIKSRALLPKPPEPEDEDEETPEQALIRQLEEYKKFKELSQEMRALEDAAKELITKLPEEYPLPPQEYELTGLTIQGLAQAFQRVLKRLEQQAENEQFERFSKREVRKEQYSVAQCMQLILKRVYKYSEVSFFSLFDESYDLEAVISVFLGLLELLKLGRITAAQENEYDDIIIRRKTENETETADEPE